MAQISILDHAMPAPPSAHTAALGTQDKQWSSASNHSYTFAWGERELHPAFALLFLSYIGGFVWWCYMHIADLDWLLEKQETVLSRKKGTGVTFWKQIMAFV